MRLCKVNGRFANAGAGLLLMTTLVACGGSSPTGPDPGPGPAPGPGTGTTPPPAPAPPPAPIGSTIDIQRSQGGNVSVVRVNRPFALANAAFDVTGRSRGGYAGRSYAETVISVGIAEGPSARSSVYYDWSSEAGRYRVSADVAWLGYLAGNGIAGSGAKMSYELEVRDFGGRLLASRMLHERELRESALSLGGVKDEGTASAVVDFTLPANTGGPFRISFILTCEAYSGILGADCLCLFGNNSALGPVNLNGYAEWTALSVTEFQ